MGSFDFSIMNITRTYLLFDDSSRILVRHLTLDTHKVGYISSRVMQGGDKELIPKGRAVDTVVQQTDRHVVPILNGFANAFDRLWISLRSL